MAMHTLWSAVNHFSFYYNVQYTQSGKNIDNVSKQATGLVYTATMFQE